MSDFLIQSAINPLSAAFRLPGVIRPRSQALHRPPLLLPDSTHLPSQGSLPQFPLSPHRAETQKKAQDDVGCEGQRVAAQACLKDSGKNQRQKPRGGSQTGRSPP